MIPYEAAAAANKALGMSPNCLTVPEIVKVVLEAAAQHMLAGVWDEGFEKGADWGEWGGGPAVLPEPDNSNSNPYRTAK